LMIPNLWEMKSISNKGIDRLIFALDGFESKEEVQEWVRLLKNRVGIFKVGTELFSRFGPEILKIIAAEDCRVFLDLKVHDIPRTVELAVKVLTDLDLFMFTMHASGGREMLRAGVSAAREVASKRGKVVPLSLAVTVLTSLSSEDLKDLGFKMPSSELTIRLAKLAKDAGVDGVVASPHEIGVIKRVCGNDFLVVSPGVRDGQVPGDDQKRVMNAKGAIMAGADFLVVGRPIRYAPDPIAAVNNIIAEIDEGIGTLESLF